MVSGRRRGLGAGGYNRKSAIGRWERAEEPSQDRRTSDRLRDMGEGVSLDNVAGEALRETLSVL